MRVLLTSHYWTPHIGGIERVVWHEAEELRRLGHEVVVVTSAVDAAGDAPDGAEIIPIPAANGQERRLGVPYPIFAPTLVGELRRRIRGCDVVHAHGLLYQPSLVSAAFAQHYGVPLVVTEHVGTVPYPSFVLSRIQSAAFGTVGRFVARRAAAVLVLNDRVRTEVDGLGARRVQVLANGVDTDRFRPRVDAAGGRHARLALGLPLEPVLALFVGRAVPRKGVDTLEAVVPRGACLVAAGSDTADGLPSGAIHLGRLSQDDMALLYRACDILLAPSMGEGFPLTVQEAMASGMAVVVRDNSVFASWAADGRLVCGDTTSGMATAAASLVVDAAARSALGERARSWATASASWAAHAASLEGLYGDVIGAGASRSVATGMAT